MYTNYKLCNGCVIIKAVDCFTMLSTGKLHTWCSMCVRNHSRKYNRNNKPDIQKRQRKYYMNNMEEVKRKARQWYSDNKKEREHA